MLEWLRMDRFLDQSKKPGEILQQDLKFSLSPQRAREIILDSAPPEEATLFKGLLFLADALRMMQGGMTPPVVKISPARVTYINSDFSLQPSCWLSEERKHWLRDRFDSPFSSAESRDLAWDRGWVRLLSTGARIQVRVGGARTEDFWGVDLSEKDGWVDRGGTPSCFVGPNSIQVFRGADWGESRNYPSGDIFALHQRLQAGRAWTISLSDRGSLFGTLFGSRIAGNTFAYRCRHFCLHERVVCDSEQLEGLDFCLTERQAYEETSCGFLLSRPKGFLKKIFVGNSDSVFSRKFLDVGSGANTYSKAKAIFSVYLDDRPAEIDLFTQGHTVETLPWPQGPPGLFGVVCWPELQTDLWGQKFLRDEEFQKAQAWISEQVVHLKNDLHQLAPKLKTEILANRTKTAYRKEVAKQIQGLWFDEQAEPSAQTLKLEETPEERAEAIRARLGM